MELAEIGDLAASSEWSRLWAADPVQHPYYQAAELGVAVAHFQPLYYLPVELRYGPEPGVPVAYDPRHLVAADDGGPVMGLVLTVERYPGRARLSAYRRPLSVVHDPGAGDGRLKSAARLIHRRLEELRARHGAEPYHVRDRLAGGRLSGLSELVLRAGGASRPFFTQVIELRRPLAEIEADLRTNVRRILRRERSGFDLSVVAGPAAGPEHRDTLRRLHRTMRGHEVRSAACWDAVLASVRAGAGFLVLGHERGECIAGAYFPCSARSCYYGIAAHDPARYGAGLSHLLLWRAIEHAHARGCHAFEVGDRVYPGQHAFVEEKLHTISHFKSGYGSGVEVRLDVFAR